MGKKIILIAELVAVMAMAVACDDVNAVNDSNTDNSQVTKEWIMEQYDISEGELSEFDVEMIADHENWKPRNVLKFYRNKEEMLHGLNVVSEQISMEKNNEPADLTAYLWESSVCEGALPDNEKIVKAAFFRLYTDETAYVMLTAMMDTQTETICFSNINDVTRDAKLADETVKLTAEEITELRQAVDYSTLKYRITDRDEGYWQIALEYDDGSVYSYLLSDFPEDEKTSKMLNAFFEKMTIDYDEFMLQ